MIAGARKVLDGPIRDVKRSGGHRHLVLSYQGDPAFLRHPAVAAFTDHGQWVEIRLAPGADPQTVLRSALDSGVRVDRFELAEPSLREVFLDKVGRRPNGRNGGPE